jgi:hypothetical protein
MRRLLSVPAALALTIFVGIGLASADPIRGHNSLLLVGTCDNGTTTSIWVTPARGHAVLDTSSTTNTVTIDLRLYSNGVLIADFVGPEADNVPVRLTTVCTGAVLGDPSSTFWELAIVTPARP